MFLADIPVPDLDICSFIKLLDYCQDGFYLVFTFFTFLCDFVSNFVLENWLQNFSYDRLQYSGFSCL